MPRPGTLLYLQKNLSKPGMFFGEWKGLGEKDQTDLKKWAEEEMDALGMEK